MSFKTFCLLLVIIILGIFIYLKVESLGSDQSSFNQTTRLSLGRHPTMRTLLSLHNDGDARYEYLSGSSPILIEVGEAPDVSLSDTLVNAFAAEVTKYTGRGTEIHRIEGMPGGTLTDAGVAQAIKVGAKKFEIGSPILFIAYADDFVSNTNEVGKTYQEFGIVLSDKKLKDITSDYPSALAQYQESTLLHELGHQLGLQHNNQDGCIMNPAVENPTSVSSFYTDFIPTDFCQYELDQLQMIQSLARGSGRGR